MPSGAEQVVLEPGTATLVDVTAALSGELLALGWSSDHPVAVSTLSQQRRDVATGSSRPAAQQGQLVSAGAGRLLVSNPGDQQATVSLAGDLTQSLVVPAGAATAVDLPDRAAVVRWNSTVPVQAGAAWQGGGLAVGGSQSTGQLRDQPVLRADQRLR